MTELIVGTKKGLFLLEGDPSAGIEIKARAFAGEPVDFATRDPASGRVLATVTSPLGAVNSNRPVSKRASASRQLFFTTDDGIKDILSPQNWL